MSNIASRMRASRVAAGHVMQIDAAIALGYSKVRYSRYELGAVRITDEVAKNVSRSFGVSMDFLVDGKVSNSVDQLAARIADVLARAPEHLDESSAHRLKQMRIVAGYASATAAAEVNGWKPPTFVAHESGARSVPAERMIGYAITLNARLEYAVLGEGPLQADPKEQQPNWANSRHDEGPDSDGHHELNWRWLNRQRGSSRQGITIVEVKEGGGLIASKERLAFSPILVPSVAAANEGTPLYGLMRRFDGGRKIWIIDPSQAISDAVQFDDRGEISMAANDLHDYRPTDIVRVGLKAGTILGSLVSTIDVRDRSNVSS